MHGGQPPTQPALPLAPTSPTPHLAQLNTHLPAACPFSVRPGGGRAPVRRMDRCAAARPALLRGQGGAARRVGPAGAPTRLHAGSGVRLGAAWQRAAGDLAPRRRLPPRVTQCNPEPGLMAMLAALGCGFDCASIQELERAFALGARRDNIIYANPAKRPADFRFARGSAPDLMTTFDCVGELDKIAAGGRAALGARHAARSGPRTLGHCGRARSACCECVHARAAFCWQAVRAARPLAGEPPASPPLIRASRVPSTRPPPPPPRQP